MHFGTVMSALPPVNRSEEWWVDRRNSLEAVRADWVRLAASSASIFSTFEWADAWWHAHRRASRTEPAIFACGYDSDAPAGLIPLYTWQERPLRVARFLGHGEADELGPIASPAAVGPVGRLLSRALDELRPDLFVGDVMLEDSVPPTLDSRTLVQEPNPRLELARFESWDDFLASRSRNFREQFRRKLRKLERTGSAQFRLSTAETLAVDLDALFELHRRRWGDSAFLRAEPFHRDFARRALDRGWLRLWMIDVGGEPVAAWYGFSRNGTMSYYNGGREPRAGDLSVGYLLLMQTVQAAVEEGCHTYSLLRGDDAYKYRLASASSDTVTVAVPFSWRGRVAARAYRPASAALQAMRAVAAHLPARPTVARAAGG